MKLLYESPLLLEEVHRKIEPGEQANFRFTMGASKIELLDAIVEGAGFSIVSRTPELEQINYRLRRETSLSDTVSENMRLLICGLNPSPTSASSGVAFFRPGNRFWPALIASGLASKDRDPLHALHVHGVGMSDLVKRTTPRAAMIANSEFVTGAKRLNRIIRWLQPQTLCFVGLAGWRAAIDRSAMSGWQSREQFGCDTYLMPSTSGLNASSSLGDLVSHFESVAAAISHSGLNKRTRS